MGLRCRLGEIGMGAGRGTKSGDRFGFVRFIHIKDVDRLVKNLCTLWMGRLRLHANVARFQRPPLNKAQHVKGAIVGQKSFGASSNSKVFSVSQSSYAGAVKNDGEHKQVAEMDSKPSLVIDESFFWIRAKEVSGWIPDFLDEDEEDKEEDESDEDLLDNESFEGVGKYDILQDPTSSEEYLDCWSLALVTLTTIAVSLPKIQNETFKSFVQSVREGLAYVTEVEENLNATDDHIRTQKAAKKLWEEVDIHHKWLGNNLKKHAPDVNAAAKILRWFNDTAKNKVTEEQSIL
nr:hypothetical protein CTI12_AA013000 [Tanacetum cinerariifolium]